MAKVTAKLSDDLLIQLSKLGDKSDDIAEKMLKAGAEVVEEEVRNALSDIIGKNLKYPSKSTGTLLSSLGTSKVRVDRNGNSNIKVGFAENRKDGKTNAMIANILEFGKSNQPAKPFIKKAKNRSKKKCEKAMTDVFDREVKKYVDS